MVESSEPKVVGDLHSSGADPDWEWWDDVVVRGAGFPAAGVSQFASLSLSAWADSIGMSPEPTSSDWEAFQLEFSSAMNAFAGLLREVARSPRFQEAIIWQNPKLMHSAVEPLLRWDPGRDNRHNHHRGHESIIASYWQRYCVKNDTIGFFGPIGWARLQVESEATELRPGESLLAGCDVYFSTWALDRLADSIAREPGMEEWLAPRRAPYLRLEKNAVILPQAAPVAVGNDVAFLLRGCNGRTPAGRIVAAAVHANVGLTSERAAYETLAELAQKRWIVSRLELPAGLRPEEDLQRFLEGIDAEPLRTRALEKLHRLRVAKERVETAADAQRLREAFSYAEETLSELVGLDGARPPGRGSGRRTILFQDCRRAIHLSLGADFMTALAPMNPLLHSARWLTFQVGEAIRRALRDVYIGIAERQSGGVDLSTFWFEAMRVVHGSGEEVTRVIVAEFQQRWNDILRCSLKDARRKYAISAVAGAIHDSFDVPASGWPAARYYSPDLMVAAPNIEAIRRGEFQIVLGELHLAINTLRSAAFVARHDSPAQLLASVDRDFPAPRLFAVLPKEDPPRLSSRTQPALVRPIDFHVALFHHSVDPSTPRLLMSGELEVKAQGEALTVTVPTGETFDVMEVLAEPLMNLIVHRFNIFGDHAHTPRINFDRLVIAREAWRIDSRELDFASQSNEARRFVETRSWCRGMKLPRQVFVKSPIEEKPFYVDFMSPIYVNLFGKAMRRVQDSERAEADALIKIVEMLPQPEETWLVDRDGQHYTSELRLVAVDMRGPNAR